MEGSAGTGTVPVLSRRGGGRPVTVGTTDEHRAGCDGRQGQSGVVKGVIVLEAST